MPSPIFWLQVAACAIVGWSFLHGALAVGPGAAAPAATGATPDSNSMPSGSGTAPPAPPPQPAGRPLPSWPQPPPWGLRYRAST